MLGVRPKYHAPSVGEVSFSLLGENSRRVGRQLRAVLFGIDGTLVRNHYLEVPDKRRILAVREALDLGVWAGLVSNAYKPGEVRRVMCIGEMLSSELKLDTELPVLTPQGLWRNMMPGTHVFNEAVARSGQPVEDMLLVSSQRSELMSAQMAGVDSLMIEVPIGA